MRIELGPAKNFLGTAAKAGWLNKNFRHDEGNATQQPSAHRKVVPLAYDIAPLDEAERKRRPTNRPYPENDGLL